MSIKYNFRYRIIQCARKTSIWHAAEVYKTTRKTVRKWVKRYQAYGMEGLKDEKKIPRHIPHKMNGKDADRIIELRKKHPKWGARRLKERYHVAGGLSAIHRVMKQDDLIKKKKKRWRKRKDLSALKKRMKFCERNQVDTKDLSDIYQYWPYIRRDGLPRYEYTYRELSTGCSFYAYANENNSQYAALFGHYVTDHLKRYGVSLDEMNIQTDNGSEYIGNVRKKIDTLSAFECVLKKSNIEHGRIPPRCSYLQGDVETFHRIIEDELYDVESYENHMEFLGKAYAYQLYFNYVRKNRYRDNKAPVDILRERFGKIDEQVLNLPPIRLELLAQHCYKDSPSGYHVPKPALDCSLFL